MGKKKTVNPFFVIIAVIIGGALYKQFDYENLTFEKPALAIVYLVTFVTTMYFLIKSYIEGPKK